jgi:hypothetical protein
LETPRSEKNYQGISLNPIITGAASIRGSPLKFGNIVQSKVDHIINKDTEKLQL